MTHNLKWSQNRSAGGIKQVLVVDDNPDEVPKISRLLRSSDKTVFVDWATNLDQARSKIARKTLFGNKYDLVIADMYLNKNEDFGADFLLECNRQYPVERLLLMSNQKREKAIQDCNYARAFSFVEKSLPVPTFVRRLRQALHLKPKPKYVEPKHAPTNTGVEKYPSNRDFLTLVALTIIFFLLATFVMVQIAKAPVAHKAIDAPLIKILEQRHIQTKIDDLLEGGLTPVIRDPNFMKPTRISWSRQQNDTANI